MTLPLLEKDFAQILDLQLSLVEQIGSRSMAIMLIPDTCFCFAELIYTVHSETLENYDNEHCIYINIYTHIYIYMHILPGHPGVSPDFVKIHFK